LTLAEIRAWFESDAPTLTMHTSGSTGTPKPIALSRNQLLAQAHLQAAFFKLKPGEKALLCLPVNRVGGLMVALRAWVAGMHVVEVPPTSHPLANLGTKENFATASLTPMQAYNSLQVPEEWAALCRIRVVLLGGGPVHPQLAHALQAHPGHVFSTYGATEMASHVAVQQLNGPNPQTHYHLLPGYGAGTHTGELQGRLWVAGPGTDNQTVQTTDEVLFANTDFTAFTYLGRADFAINSGGLKFFPETLEALAAPVLAGQAFAFTAVPHTALGQAIALVVVGAPPTGEQLHALAAALPPHAKPRHVLCLGALPTTSGGKIDRKALMQLAETELQKMR